MGVKVICLPQVLRGQFEHRLQQFHHIILIHFRQKEAVMLGLEGIGLVIWQHDGFSKVPWRYFLLCGRFFWPRMLKALMLLTKIGEWRQQPWSGLFWALWHLGMLRLRLVTWLLVTWLYLSAFRGQRTLSWRAFFNVVREGCFPLIRIAHDLITKETGQMARLIDALATSWRGNKKRGEIVTWISASRRIRMLKRTGQRQGQKTMTFQKKQQKPFSPHRGDER